MRTALICVLIAGLLPYLWTAVAKILGPRYDNRHVREWQSKLTGVCGRLKCCLVYEHATYKELSRTLPKMMNMKIDTTMKVNAPPGRCCMKSASP